MDAYFKSRNMKYVTDKKIYSLTQFCEAFTDSLPKMVMITHGYTGRFLQLQLHKGQILSIRAVSRQNRMLALCKCRDRTKLISIPTDYNEPLCIVKDGRAGPRDHLFRLMKGQELPVKVQYPPDKIIKGTVRDISSNRIPPIELIKEFDEVHLAGNILVDGKMSEDVIYIPLYLTNVRMCLVHGIEGQTKESWLRLLQNCDRVSAGLEYDQEYGKADLAEYDSSAKTSAHPFTLVQPNRYTNIVGIVLSPPKVPQKQEKGGDKEYEKLNLKEDTDRVYDKIGSENLSTINFRSPYEGVPVLPRQQSFEVNKGTREEDSQYCRSLSITENVARDVKSSHDVTALTIQEVGDYLDVLNLGNYKAKMEDFRVDGKVLQALDVDTMVADFGMKKVEAILLTQFAIHGHVPK